MIKTICPICKKPIKGDYVETYVGADYITDKPIKKPCHKQCAIRALEFYVEDLNRDKDTLNEVIGGCKHAKNK